MLSSSVWTDEVYEHYARHDYYSQFMRMTQSFVVVDTFVNGTIPNAQAEGIEIYEALITHNDGTSSWKTSRLCRSLRNRYAFYLSWQARHDF